MKAGSILLLCLMPLLCFGQSGTYYHDTTLDAINNDVGYLNSDLNGGLAMVNSNLNYLSYMTNLLTIGQLVTNANNNGAAVWTNSYNMQSNGVTPGTVSVSLAPNPFAATNAGSLFATALTSNFDKGSSDLAGFTNYSTSDGTNNNSLSSISLGSLNGTSFTLDLSLGTGGYISNSLCVYIRGVIYSIFVIMFYVVSFQFVHEAGLAVLNQRQMAGSGQSILGTNAKVVTGIAFAAVVTTLMSTILGTLFTSALITAHSAAFSNVTGFLSSAPTNYGAWSVITAFFPVGQIFALYINYLAFRFLYGVPALMAIHGVILWFVR